MARRFLRALAVFSALSVILAACGSSAKTGQPPTSGGSPTTSNEPVPDGGTLVVGAEQEPDCFDWVGQRILANFAVPAGNMAHLTYPHPLLAQKPVRAGDRWCLFTDIGSLQNLNWIGYAFTSP